MQCQSLGQSTVLGGRIVGEQGSPYKDHMDGVSGDAVSRRKPGELEGVEGRVAKGDNRQQCWLTQRWSIVL